MMAVCGRVEERNPTTDHFLFRPLRANSDAGRRRYNVAGFAKEPITGLNVKFNLRAIAQ